MNQPNKDEIRSLSEALSPDDEIGVRSDEENLLSSPTQAPTDLCGSKWHL